MLEKVIIGLQQGSHKVYRLYLKDQFPWLLKTTQAHTAVTDSQQFWEYTVVCWEFGVVQALG